MGGWWRACRAAGAPAPPVLLDAGGSDKYSAGLFAQGAGYWYGVGLLLDEAGNDSYEGVWYVQGSAAHFAVGILV